MIKKKKKDTKALDKNIIYVGYKFRIYPSDKQKVFLEKHFGCTRFLYNYFLNLRSEEWKTNKKNISGVECEKMIVGLKDKEEFKWLKEVNSQSLQQSVLNLDVSFKKFFNKKSKYPQFKKKSNNHQSFMVPQHFDLRLSKKENYLLSIPKLKSDIKIEVHREMKGKIKSISISRTPNKRYFASFNCEINKVDVKKRKNIIDKDIGIDLNTDAFIATDEGLKVPNPKHLQKTQKKLKRAQSLLSKTQKKSKNREKQKLKVAKIHNHIKNQRLDFLHKLSFKIVDENQIIYLEDLNIKGMMQNHNLAKSVASCSWSEFVRQLKYKAEWRNKNVIQIGRFDPSSKMCSFVKCGFINHILQLKDKEWTCPKCGTFHDRNTNAGRNIKNLGRDYARIQVCGEMGLYNNSIKLLQACSMKQKPDLLEGKLSLDAREFIPKRMSH